MDLEAVARRTWAGATASDRMLRAALGPAAAAYGAVAALRNRLYDAGWLPAARVPAQVISVGNLAVGGTGKTPTALWLAEQLAARGRRVAIVARGYRKQRRGVVVVGEEGRPLVAPEEGGDEAVLLARRFPGPVLTAERRVDAAAAACARFAVDTIVLDDGFQHRALARDADLVLAAATSSDRLLPAGPLREPPTSLARARATLAIDADPLRFPGIPAFRARLMATAVVSATWTTQSLDTLRGREVVAVAGVANPTRFSDTLTAAGATVRQLLRYPDHHAYDARDVATIRTAGGNDLVVTTEKDLVKLARFPQLDGNLVALRVSLSPEDPEALLRCLITPVG